MYALIHIVQACPVGQIGVIVGLTLAPGPYIWHPWFKTNSEATP